MSDAPGAKRWLLSGETYWKMQGLLEKADEKIKDYQAWAREQCRKLKLIPDLADLVAGVVYDRPSVRNPMDPPRLPVSRIEDDAVVTEANRRSAEVDQISRELGALVRQVAMKLGIRTDQVNPKTGEIMMNPEGVEMVDVKLGADAKKA